MGFLTIFWITTCVGCTLSALSDWTVLLWLRSDENIEPSSVWSDNSSIYNSDATDTLDVLYSSNRMGYRYTLIDRWSDNPPDRIKISYRNNDGVSMYEAVFNSTDTSSQDWFVESKSLSGLSANWWTATSMTYDSHNTSFVVYDTAWGAQRYVAASITLHNGIVLYVVGNKNLPVLLPANNTEPAECHPSIGVTNPFGVNYTVTYLTHEYCSALCREENYLYGATHNVTCSCISGDVATLNTPIDACTIPCEGEATQMCGGTIAPGAVAFNLVHTGIDVSQFDQPQAQGTMHVTGALEVSYTSPTIIYGFNISIDVLNLPVTIDMYLYHRAELCNESAMENHTLIKSFTMSVADTFYMLDIEPVLAQCYYVYLYEATTTNPISFTVHMDVIALSGAQFATADIFTIEAAWETVDTCECECWLHDMLYGDSPYDNLTYAEIEEALKNVTDQIVKELSVNVSTLSSTLRKKTSADDDRESATAIGYTLGVSILVCTLVAIILADVPKLIAGVKLFHKSLTNRFCESSAKSKQTK